MALYFAFDGHLMWSCYLIGIAGVFDFLDGFVARLLKVHSEIGKQLDSLADMVTFGVVPGIIAFKMLWLWNLWGTSIPEEVATFYQFVEHGLWDAPIHFTNLDSAKAFLPFVAFLIPVFSAFRLAKFNIDTRQSDGFIGLPTPATAIFFGSLPLLVNYLLTISPQLKGFEWVASPWLILPAIALFSFLMVSELPALAFKFKTFNWKGNEARFLFLGLAILLLLSGVLITSIFVAIPIILLLYILFSIVAHLISKQGHEIQS